MGEGGFAFPNGVLHSFGVMRLKASVVMSVVKAETKLVAALRFCESWIRGRFFFFN